MQTLYSVASLFDSFTHLHWQCGPWRQPIGPVTGPSARWFR